MKHGQFYNLDVLEGKGERAHRASRKSSTSMGRARDNREAHGARRKTSTSTGTRMYGNREKTIGLAESLAPLWSKKEIARGPIWLVERLTPLRV